MDEPHCYRIVLRGELSPRFRPFFEGMSFARAGGNTVPLGEIVDQAHLARVLNHVPVVELFSVDGVEPSSPRSGEPPGG